MSRAPNGVQFGIIVCCEERGVHGLANLDNRAIDAFAEAGFVTDFFQKRSAANKDNLCAEGVDFEDGACITKMSTFVCMSAPEVVHEHTPFGSQLVQRGPRVARINVKDVSQQRNTRWLRDLGHHFV